MSQDVITLSLSANVWRTMWNLHQGNEIPSLEEAQRYDAEFWKAVQEALEADGQI